MIQTVAKPRLRFSDFTATWYDRLKAFDGDKSAIKARVQNDSSPYHVRLLRREVAAIDTAFVDPLLVHIDAVLKHKFRREFPRTYHDECNHQCVDSAAASLFRMVNWATGRREK